MSPQEARKVIADQNKIIMKLCKEKNALQAKIDQLMIESHCRRKSGEQEIDPERICAEYTIESSVAISDQECPEEMTQEQIENWEQHQVKSNYPKLVITTGDDVSDVVWTKEKLEELQRFVDKIKQEEQSGK